jgi:hypothetical protein
MMLGLSILFPVEEKDAGIFWLSVFLWGGGLPIGVLSHKGLSKFLKGVE